jgi:hypothetical protein
VSQAKVRTVNTVGYDDQDSETHDGNGILIGMVQIDHVDDDNNHIDFSNILDQDDADYQARSAVIGIVTTNFEDSENYDYPESEDDFFTIPSLEDRYLNTVWGPLISLDTHKTQDDEQATIFWKRFEGFCWEENNLNDAFANINLHCEEHQTFSAWEELKNKYRKPLMERDNDILYIRLVRHYAVMATALGCWSFCSTKHLPKKIPEYLAPAKWGQLSLKHWSDCYQEYKQHEQGKVESLIQITITTNLEVPHHLQNKYICVDGLKED